jgi:hypothetical protein
VRPERQQLQAAAARDTSGGACGGDGSGQLAVASRPAFLFLKSISRGG